MPTVSRFLGIDIIFNYRGEHNPPHFHAVYSGTEGSFQISPLGYLNGNLPPRVIALVLEWAAMHQDELSRAWELARAKQSIPSIEPLV